MKAPFYSSRTLFFCFLVILGTTITQAQEVNWISFAQAVELATEEENPKKVFIDVYTDWCG